MLLYSCVTTVATMRANGQSCLDEHEIYLRKWSQSKSSAGYNIIFPRSAVPINATNSTIKLSLFIVQGAYKLSEDFVKP